MTDDQHHDEDERERRQNIADGMAGGRELACSLIDVAIKHGTIGVYQAVGLLDEHQAKWALALLVAFEKDRIDTIVELSGYQPN